MSEQAPPQVTVLYPCYNEEEALGECIDRALAALKDAGLNGEVLVVDNNSTDRSVEIATERGARVVTETRQGYGAAYLCGLREAYGEYIVMLDADGTYPVEMTGEFVKYLRDDGFDMVIGNRFGGQMEKDAMPLANRYIGNPILSGMTRLLYRVRLKDMHCGMRGIRKSIIPTLGLQTPGMEFATEMIVKALDVGVKTKEITIPYRPRVGDSKLNPIRDAWRHVEYMLVFAPGVSLLGPGILLMLFGVIVQILLVAGPRAILFRTWDVHTNVLGLTTALTGNTLFVLGVVSAALAWALGMKFRHSALARLMALRGEGLLRVAGSGLLLAGLGIWGTVAWSWFSSGLGSLSALPVLTLGSTALAMGVEMLGGAFLVAVIALRK